jgi:hypothetical protein
VLFKSQGGFRLWGHRLLRFFNGISYREPVSLELELFDVEKEAMHKYIIFTCLLLITLSQSAVAQAKQTFSASIPCTITSHLGLELIDGQPVPRGNGDNNAKFHEAGDDATLEFYSTSDGFLMVTVWSETQQLSLFSAMSEPPDTTFEESYMGESALTGSFGVFRSQEILFYNLVGNLFLQEYDTYLLHGFIQASWAPSPVFSTTTLNCKSTDAFFRETVQAISSLRGR